MRSGYDWCGGGREEVDPYGGYDMMGGGSGGKPRPAEVNPVAANSTNEADNAAVKTAPVTMKTPGPGAAVKLNAASASVKALPARERADPVAARAALVPPPAEGKNVGVAEFGARVLEILQGRRHGLFSAQVPHCTVLCT